MFNSHFQPARAHAACRPGVSGHQPYIIKALRNPSIESSELCGHVYRIVLMSSAVLAFFAFGCINSGPSNPAPAPVDAAIPDAAIPDVSPSMATNGIDILFVIDNSLSMSEEQGLLATGFTEFVAAMEAAYGARPDLQFGVISTDVGIGPGNGGIGCSLRGDNGTLRTNPACNIADRFIIDIHDGAGSRWQNFTGSLSDAMSCLSQLGDSGCGFEQPLASVRRALDGDNPFNYGFLRDNAMLAIVIVSDEDDCSVSDTTMFDPDQNDINAPLGPLSSFRCFEFGVVCEPDDPRVPGLRTNCKPRTDSAYMPSIQEYADFVTGLKPPGEIIVATVLGPSAPVAVVLDTQNDDTPKLAPSCTSMNGAAAPSVRLQTFQAAFPQRNLQHSICAPSLDSALVDLGTMIGTILP